MAQTINQLNGDFQSLNSSFKTNSNSKKVKMPVSIEGIEFDALISQDETLEAEIPEYPVETGYSVTDSIILGSEKLDMVLFVTDTPVTWYKRHGSGNGRVDDVEKKLKQLYYKKIPVKVVTSSGVFENMGIESITFSKSTELGYAREIPISMRKIRITSAKTTTIPDSYGKSGETGASAGSANTESEDAGESKGKSSSILYNIAQSIKGLFSK